MAAKPFYVVVVALFLVGCTSAFGPMYNRRFSSQLPQLVSVTVRMLILGLSEGILLCCSALILSRTNLLDFG